jgi:biofilm PGA synthesis N-glycosyltransferase PgaC
VPARRARGTASIVALTAAAAVGHVVYPAALAALARRRARTPEPVEPLTEAPPITVLIPAYLEAGTIAAKIRDAGDNGYPGSVTVLVVAEDRDTASAARAAGADVLEPEERLGKSGAINLGVDQAGTDIVVATDANNVLAPGSLATLVAHLADPTVGAVAGEKVEDDEGEAAYWKFESWLKQQESALGTTIGIVGELFAVRRSVWQPIPPDVLNDDLWTALDLAERGYRVVYEPAARAVERSAEGGHQWERRTRITSAALHVFWLKRHLVAPQHGFLAFQIVGHKLWRSTIGPVANVALVAVSLRHARRNPLARLVLAGHAAGVAGLLLRRAGKPAPKVLVVAGQVLYLQGVALDSLRRYLRRDISPRWAKPPR